MKLQKSNWLQFFSTFNECNEEKKLYKNGFFRFLTFIWENFVLLWIEENSGDNRFKAFCSAYAESLQLR